MAISEYGELKNALNTYMFHQRFVTQYDNCVGLFETSADSRLRVRPMEAVVLLTTTNGDVALPSDYLVWRTVKPTTTPYIDELDYVHPAYLPATQYNRRPPLFTIEGNTLKVRPVADSADAYELHYYQKIPTLVGNDANTNWLLTAYPNAYLFGVMVELAALSRNQEMAQLYKQRRDEVFQEIIQLSALTTGATSPTVRTAEYL